jgi:predicted nucleic acid-binding protein
LSLIVDMSVVLAWFFEEEHTAKALSLLRRVEKDGMLVPPLWWYELENGLIVGERRGRKSAAESTAFLSLVSALPIETDDAPRHRLSESIIAVGREYGLTAYDASYVELAARRGATLATFDLALRRCAASLGVKVAPNPA